MRNIIKSSHEHQDAYKTSFLFNEPLKSYSSLYLATFSMKSISHTFARFETTQAKLIELIFETFYKNLYNPAGIYLFKVNNRNTRTRCEICSKLTIKTPERRH